jgi:hypothetical protein
VTCGVVRAREENRTPDLRITSALLCRLSYSGRTGHDSSDRPGHLNPLSCAGHDTRAGTPLRPSSSSSPPSPTSITSSLSRRRIVQFEARCSLHPPEQLVGKLPGPDVGQSPTQRRRARSLALDPVNPLTRTRAGRVTKAAAPGGPEACCPSRRTAHERPRAPRKSRCVTTETSTTPLDIGYGIRTPCRAVSTGTFGALEIQRDRFTNEALQCTFVDAFAFFDVDGTPDLALEARVEET